MKNIYSILTVLMLLITVSLAGQERIYPPDLRAPEDGESGQNPNVTLDWDAVAGQTLEITYEVQIATTEDFSDAFTFPRTDLTAQETSELLFGQRYFWRVKAFDADEPSEWSESWSFVVLSTVTITNPDIGDEVFVNPEIEWDEITGIKGYELQIDTTYVWNVQSTATTEDLNGTFVLDENNMWLVGAGGVVQYFDGSTWTALDAGTTENLFGVFFVSSTDGYVVGEGGTIVHYDGSAWTPMDAGTTANLTAIYFADADNGWAVGEEGTVLKYSAGSWAAETSDTENDLTGVYALSSSDVWASGLKKTILHFDGNGWVSSEIGNVDLYSIWFTDPSNGWVSGRSGKIYYFDGTEWTEQATGTNRNLYGISMSGNTGYAVGRNGTMVAFNNGSWSEVTSGVSVDLNGIWLSADQGLAAGLEGSVIRKSGTGFDSPFMRIINIVGDTAEYQLELLPFGSNVYYRMRSHHDQDTSDWSGARSMFTQAAPDLDKPNNNTSNSDLRVLFRWKEYEGAVDYIYEIARDEDFNNSFEASVDSTSINYQMNIFGETYHWRVRAQHPLDISDWSTVYNVTTTDEVNLESPDDGETDVASCPKYVWEEIIGAKSYQIMIDTDENFGDPLVRETSIPSYQCQSPLPKKTIFYWRVRAISTLDTSAWSQVWSLETEGYIGIEDQFASEAVEVYPNPSEGVFTLFLSNLTQGTYQISVSDLTGRKILEEHVELGAGDHDRQYRLDYLDKGIYLLKIGKGAAAVTKKIFIN